MRHLLEVIGSFPVKKRQNKKKIVNILGSELVRRDMLAPEDWEEFERIIGEDKKIG